MARSSNVLDKHISRSSDIFTQDAGKQFMSRLFQTNAELIHIQTKAVPVESPNSMKFVERYHGPLRRAFNIINSESTDLSNEEALQLSVKALNDSVGPDGLVRTLLVYGAIPRFGFSSDRPSPNMIQRANALHKATQETSRHFGSTQIISAVHTRNGPDTSYIRHALVNTPILVYRPELDKWDGVYRL